MARLNLNDNPEQQYIDTWEGPVVDRTLDFLMADADRQQQGPLCFVADVPASGKAHSATTQSSTSI